MSDFFSKNTPKNQQSLNIYIKDIKEILNNLNFESSIRLIANDDFKKEILDPVIASSSLVADTSELFIRSIQLSNIFSQKESRTLIEDNNIKQIDESSSGSLDEMKVGVFVKSNLERLFKGNKINKDELDKMTTAVIQKRYLTRTIQF